MSVLNEKSVFTSLKQKGPLAARDKVELDRYFSAENRAWVRNLKLSELDVTKYRALRSQIFEFLNLRSFRDIESLLHDSEARRRCSRRACTLLGNVFGISGTEQEIIFKVTEYARTADSVIKSLQSKLFAPYASHVAITNEVEIATDPVDLLLMIFDDRYHKRPASKRIASSP